MSDIYNLVKKIRFVSQDRKIVFVHGKFNILHPGHLRLLKFAKDNGEFLVVAIDNYTDTEGLLEAEIRLEAVQHSMFVDYAFILDIDVMTFLEELKPSVMVKGSEHENQYNKETNVLKLNGGKLIFSSGDIRFSTISLLQDEFKVLEHSNIKKMTSYIDRHKIDSKKILTILERFKDLNILVIGDTIIDEYITCEPLGMSQEDPTIVVSPISSNIFLGGAGIVAAHSVGLGAKVDFFTVLGNDNYAHYVKDKSKEYDINAHIYVDTSRPTTLKQRFRANKKTLLRVNHLKQHHIDIEMQDKIFNDIEKMIYDKNLIVFSDFSYGCLPQRLIDKITEIGLKNNIMLVADSQSSSQTGDITKFKNMSLVSPTEREARLGVSDFESGLIVLAEKIRKKSNIKNVFVTLGSEGVLIHANNDKNNEDEWITDQIEALNTNPKDVAGAGDSFLISSSMSMATGASILESAYIGSIAAACQVGRVGNIPLSISEIKKEILK